MKLKFSNLLTSLAAVILLTLSAKAQDEMPILETQDPNRRELNLNEDKSLLYERSNHSTLLRDSLSTLTPRIVPVNSSTTKTAAKPEGSRNTAKDNDDALSFNFLYYMLQKFKFSDLVDQH